MCRLRCLIKKAALTGVYAAFFGVVANFSTALRVVLHLFEVELGL